MACLAPVFCGNLVVGATRLRDLAPMRVCMARNTGDIWKMELRRRTQSRFSRVLVAISARDGKMGANEGEASFLVVGNRKGRRAKSLYGMTGLTTIPMGLCCELSRVSISMAIDADGVFGVIVRVTTHRQMTLLARHAAMLSGERIVRLSVACLDECRRLEARLGMA